MWYAQVRVWEAFPPAGDLLRMLAAVHYKSLRKPPKRQPKSRTIGPSMNTTMLDAPLTKAELDLLARRGQAIR